MANRQQYAAKMELKKQKRFAAGLIAEHYPEVSSIVIHMTYYQNGTNPVLMVRTVNVSPASSAYFNMDCMIKGCENGGFDLTPIVDHTVKAHKKEKKGTLTCCGKVDAVVPDHARVDYEIAVQYHKIRR